MARIYNADSVSVTSRVKLRELAVALRYMEERGVRPRTRSEIVSLCVQAVAAVIPEEEWPSLDDAILELDGRFPVATRKGANLLTSQSSPRRREIIEASEAAWRQEGARMRGQAQVGGYSWGEEKVGGATMPPPEMRQKDGMMYIIHATNEGLREDGEKYRAQIAAGTVKVVSREEWAEIDRAPTLGLDALMGNDAL